MNMNPKIWTNFYENHLNKEDANQMDSTTKSDIELPPRNLSQRWRRYGHDAKRRVFERFSKWCPKGTATSNLFIYLKTDQTFPEFVVKSVIGFFGGIVLTYLCFVFFVFQLSISLIHATIMSSIIGVLLTFGLAFSYRIRCLVFLLVPQLFSRVGRYTLTCYALVLILTGPATNTLKNSEVLTESMACTQEQIKTDVKQIADSEKKPFSSMRDAIKVMIKRLNEISYEVDVILAKINKLVISIVDVLQSSYIWLYTVIDKCNERFGTPYDHCIKVLTYDPPRRDVKKMQRILYNNSFARLVCSAVNFNSKVCNAPEYLEESIAATIKRKLRTFMNRVKAMFLIKVHMHHCYTFTSNSSRSPSQVTAGIVTEIRNRADPLLTWLSWSSCITSLFLLLIIFRAKYYQHMFETRSRFDNRYITKELRHLDLQRIQEGRETVLPLNRRERAKYVTTTSLRLVASEKVHLARSIVFMTITTFKLMIHMIADYSLYWVLTTIRYHGKRQTQLPPGPMDAGLLITGTGLIADLIRAVYKALLSPIVEGPSPMSCLPNPYPPDLKRYAQIADNRLVLNLLSFFSLLDRNALALPLVLLISMGDGDHLPTGVLIFLLWFFALFEPYGLRLRHLIMGHYRPERAKARAAWLYNHILRTRGSFMKFARRKLHKEFKYLPQENLTFRYWLRTRIPCRWLRCLLGIAPLEPQCLLCYAKEVENLPNSDLIRCETQNCPGIYCNGCFSDIGRLCTICLSPVDYGDFSDISLEKGSSEDSDDSSPSESDTTNLLPKRKSFMKSHHSRDGHEQDNLIGNMNKSNSRKPRFYSSNQSNKNNDKTPLLYLPNEELEKDNICNKHLTAETLDFVNLAVPKNNLTIGFVYHNYFCDNLVNLSTEMFKKYDNTAKDYSLYPRKKNKVHYGSFEKTLDTQQFKGPEPNFNQFNLMEKKPISPKTKPVDTIKNPNSILAQHSTAKVFPKTEEVKIKSQYKLKSRSKVLTVKRRYSRDVHNKRENKKILFNHMKRKWSKTLCYIRSSMTGMTNTLGNTKIKFNLYDIKKSSSTISISKILVGTKIKYRRKGKYSKSNDLQKGTHCTNNATSINLQENNKTKLRNNLPFKASNKGANDGDNLNICDQNKDIPKVNSKNQHSKNCLSIRKIRKLMSNITIIRCTLKRICYSQKKSKADHLTFLKYKHNYKRRKKYREMAKEKAQRRREVNATNKTLNIRNDIEITRKYRIYSFLKEGDWIKGRPGNVSEPQQENRAITVNNIKNYCAGLKSYIQEITKTRISKSNEHLSCARDGNKICESVNDKKEDWSDKSIYHTHLPVLSKSDSHEKIGKVTFGHLKMSSSVKSFSLNNVKLYIAKKFVHVKFEKPITVLRTLLSAITLAKDKVSTPEIMLRDNKNTVDKDVTVSPIVKPCSCQCEIIKDTIEHPEPCGLPNSPKRFYELRDDKHTQTEIKSCTCATQYTIDDTRMINYESFIHDLFKDYDNDETRKDIKSFTSDSTRTDTTLCSCVTVDFIDEEPIVKNKRATKKVNVITKSNQSTATDMTNLRNASTVTSDWWSPILEKKEMDYKRGNYFFKKKREAKPASFLNRRLVTFKSRTQIIPNEGSYILSPSRYLLESQKYYNELFSPRFYAPHLFPMNRTSRIQKAANVSTNRINKNKPKATQHKIRRNL